MVARHRRRGGPGEVVVQHSPEWVGREPHIFQSLIEACDRPAVHLLVQTVTAVDPNHRRLVAIGIGVARGPA